MFWIGRSSLIIAVESKTSIVHTDVAGFAVYRRTAFIICGRGQVMIFSGSTADLDVKSVKQTWGETKCRYRVGWRNLGSASCFQK